MIENQTVAIADRKPPSAISIDATSLPSAATLLGIGLLIVVLSIAYSPAIQGRFIWDDNLLIAKNHLVHAPNGLARIWFSTQPFDYWPLTNTTFWIEWRLWGANTLGYHVVNIVLHLVATLLLWAILSKLSIPGAYLAALLFAVHPVNVESVAWIAQRKNTLAMVFFLLSILWFLRAENVRTRWYWLSLLAFVLAMLSKGSVAILPLVLLLIVWWKRERVDGRDLRRVVPFVVVAVVLAGVNIWFQTHGGEAIRSASLTERIAGAGATTWFYLSKAILPIDLVFVYAQWHIGVRDFLWWLPLLSALIVTAVLCWRGRGPQSKWRRSLLFAWAFFCVALLPVLGLTDVYFMKFALVADHYQYIALIGVAALAAAGWSRLRESNNPTIQTGALLGAIAVLGSFTLLDRRQSALYTDPTTLYEATLDANPSCWLAHVNLGQEYLDAGRLADATKHFEQAALLKPDLPEAHNNLGRTLIEGGSAPQAIVQLEEALRLKPDYAEAHDNLATALTVVGRTQEARQHLQQALELKPDVPEFHNNAAIELAMAGEHQEAIRSFEHALELNPDYADAHYNLAIELSNIDRLPEAIDHYRQALRLKPNYLSAHKNLAQALLQAKQPDEAVDHYLQALRLKPDDAQSYASVLNVYPALNRPADAMATAQKVLALARSKGQAALAEQIEAWLINYRLQQGEPLDKLTPERAAGSAP